MDFIRDYVMYMAVFGLFSFSWFGWAQEGPRASWRIYLGIASGVGFVVGGIGIYLSFTHWDQASALHQATAFNLYLLFAWAEIILCVIGAVVLFIIKKRHAVAPWVAFIVGSHFIGLASVFRDPSLYVLAGIIMLVACVSIPLARRLQVAPSAICGIGTGSALLCFAIIGFLRFLMT